VTAVPLQFATKAEAVYEELRRRILSGALEPAAPLNQEALAPELGVSVTPVREAMRRLEAEGLVQFEAHKTVIVRPLSRDELAEIYDVRLKLDPHAAALATSRVTESELRELELLARAQAGSDPVRQVGLNRAFHRAIYARSGNDLLTEILDRLWERTDRYRIMLVTRDIDVVTAAREHAEIVRAMRARQPRTVAKLIRAHVANARSSIDDALGGD
jgi:DNA-binding GntR family transcriptional regulator